MQCLKLPTVNGKQKQLRYDEFLKKEGRVMEMLSEHQCEGWLEGYILNGTAWTYLIVMKHSFILLIPCSISMQNG